MVKIRMEIVENHPDSVWSSMGWSADLYLWLLCLSGKLCRLVKFTWHNGGRRPRFSPTGNYYLRSKSSTAPPHAQCECARCNLAMHCCNFNALHRAVAFAHMARLLYAQPNRKSNTRFSMILLSPQSLARTHTHTVDSFPFYAHSRNKRFVIWDLSTFILHYIRTHIRSTCSPSLPLVGMFSVRLLNRYQCRVHGNGKHNVWITAIYSVIGASVGQVRVPISIFSLTSLLYALFTLCAGRMCTVRMAA